MGELKALGKPFGISKWAVWEAWEKVKANKGAPGVDGQSIAEFEKDLQGNLYQGPGVVPFWCGMPGLG